MSSGEMVFNGSPVVRWTTYSLCGLLLVLAAYHPVLDLWWGWDDLHWLLLIQEHTPYDYFFNSQFYEQAKIIFTPIEILSYELNYWLFGLSPLEFYVYQLVVAWLVFLATVRFLLLWCNQYWALTGAALACLSAPLVISVYQIQCVQYLQGLLFTVLSVTLYVHALRVGNWRWTLLGAGFYLLASASKEIYIPIVLVLPFLPERGIAVRVYYGLPYALAALLYVIWRYRVLGVFASGFGVDAPLAEFLFLPFLAVYFVAGKGILGIACVLAYSMVVALATGKRMSRMLLLFVVLLVLLMPLYPIAYRITGAERSLVLLAWLLCTTSVILVSRHTSAAVRGKYFSIGYLMLLTAGLAQASLPTAANMREGNARFRTVGEHVFSAPEGHALLLTGEDYRAREAKRLRQLLTGNPGPRLFYDPLQVEMSRDGFARLFHYDHARNRMVDLTASLPDFLADWQERTREKPLSLSLRRAGRSVYWEFGPYERANYSVVLLSRDFAFARVRRNGRYSGSVPPMEFVLRYQAPEGWITYSDVLRWNNREGEHLVWSR